MLENMTLQCEFLKINPLICAAFGGLTLRKKKTKINLPQEAYLSQKVTAYNIYTVVTAILTI